MYIRIETLNFVIMLVLQPTFSSAWTNFIILKILPLGIEVILLTVQTSLSFFCPVHVLSDRMSYRRVEAQKQKSLLSV